MRQKINCLAAWGLAVLLLTVPARASAAFPDVDENAPYAEAAEYLNDIGVMNGDTNGNFNPDQTVTRAQMAAILCRVLGETEDLPTDGDRFTDVPASYWANGYIVKAAELGIIGGYQDGSFKPGNAVTYEQAVTMVIRAFGYEDEASSAGGYPDGYLAVAQNLGLLNNVGRKNGKSLDRGSVAIIIYNCYHSYV